MSGDALSWLAEELHALRSLDLHRVLRRVDGPQETEVTIDGTPCLLLASNNYLGLANDPRLKAGAMRAIERYGTGAGASRLISGHLDIHEELEARLAEFKRTEAALAFGSGYLANLGVITSLTGPGDTILSDQLNHASIIDGCRLSGASVRIYRHRDPDHVARLLAEETGRSRRTLIVTEAVFSMDGDLAPLAELASLADRYGAMLMVDEAHATGVLGPRGAGAIEALGLEGRVPIIMATLSKALGSIGGFIAGPRQLIDYLRNRARSFVFTTGLPPAAAGAALAAIEIVTSEPERRRRLLEIAKRIAAELGSLGFRVLAPDGAIVPVVAGETTFAVALAEGLRARGVFCPAIRPPTVPEGQSRLRVVPMATHTDAQIERALAVFKSVRDDLGLAEP